MALALIKRYTINPMTLIFSPEIECNVQWTNENINENENKKSNAPTKPKHAAKLKWNIQNKSETGSQCR